MSAKDLPHYWDNAFVDEKIEKEFILFVNVGSSQEKCMIHLFIFRPCVA